jgi:DNA-binding transcriptional MerR regulator
MDSSVADEQSGGKRGERIAQTAARHGVTVATLRLYEQQGILPPARRTRGGHRRYDERDLDWVDTVMLMRATGMSTTQMAHISALIRSGNRDEAESLTAAHAEAALQRALILQRNARELQRRRATMPATHPPEAH